LSNEPEKRGNRLRFSFSAFGVVVGRTTTLKNSLLLFFQGLDICVFAVLLVNLAL
jgi:hypothetical protein